MSEKKYIRLLIADDHQMFVDGLKSSLTQTDFVSVTGTANTGKQVLDFLEENETDMVLLDINMPEMNGIETAKIIVKKYPAIRIIMLSMYLEKQLIEELVRIGISGYILKNTGVKELEQAIRTVSEGKKHFSNDVALKLLDAQTNTVYANESGQLPLQLPGLTERETEVLKLIAKEFTTPEIAEKLFISAYTVETHRKNLIRKLNVKNIAGLVKFAVQNGLIT
jgi:two-component system, NarL family, nitrate/nitrite response regulator NarL